jgi:hypothetical protein
MNKEINDMSSALLDKEFAGEDMVFSDQDITKLCLALGTALNSRIWDCEEDDITKLEMITKASKELREFVLKWSDVDYHYMTQYIIR